MACSKRGDVSSSPHRRNGIQFFSFLVLISCTKVVRCFAVGAGGAPRRTGISTASSGFERPGRQSLKQQQQQEGSVLRRKSSPVSQLSAAVPASTGISDEEGEDPSEEEGEIEIRGGASINDIPTRMWPCFDALDKRMIKIALPVIANFAINPLIGAVDLFWVNRMGNPLAVAGQAAANQVFSSAFWLTSFLPSVTATLIARENANGDKDAVQDAVCQALFVGMFISVISTAILLINPDRVLSAILKEGAPALEYARPYLLIRAFAFLPSLISLVGFSAFRGILETSTPVKISLFANVFNAILDPILIFTLSMGVPGAAVATLVAEIISAVAYLYLLRKRDLIRFAKLIRLPTWKKLEPLLRGGAALQLRNVALNITFLAVARVTQSIDDSGVAAAAHAMAIQVFQVGGIVLLALSTVSQTVVPNEMVERYDRVLKRRVGGRETAKATVNRLMSWGFILGIALGGMQIALLPVIQRSTPLQEVRDAAKIPAIMASVFQIMNGLVFIGEGVMVGCGSYLQLSLSTVVATAGCLWALRTFPPLYGLSGVWMAFGVFNSLRLGGVYLHQFVNGPLAPKAMAKSAKE
jgi:MATE family multidrug resistance protein